jgi:hypothetical protein
MFFRIQLHLITLCTCSIVQTLGSVFLAVYQVPWHKRAANGRGIMPIWKRFRISFIVVDSEKKGRGKIDTRMPLRKRKCTTLYTVQSTMRGNKIKWKKVAQLFSLPSHFLRLLFQLVRRMYVCIYSVHTRYTVHRYKYKYIRKWAGVRMWIWI